MHRPINLQALPHNEYHFFKSFNRPYIEASGFTQLIDLRYFHRILSIALLAVPLAFHPLTPVLHVHLLRLTYDSTAHIYYLADLFEICSVI
jgi:hypothetical protein